MHTRTQACRHTTRVPTHGHACLHTHAQMRMMVRSEVRNALLSLGKLGVLGGGSHAAHGTSSYAPTSAGPTPAPSGRLKSFADAVSMASGVTPQVRRGGVGEVRFLGEGGLFVCSVCACVCWSFRLAPYAWSAPNQPTLTLSRLSGE